MCVVVVKESHLSVHTWPEAGYAAVDFFSCGDCAPEEAHAVLREGLGAERSELMVVHRGLTGPDGSMRVERHGDPGDSTPSLTPAGIEAKTPGHVSDQRHS